MFVEEVGWGLRELKVTEVGDPEGLWRVDQPVADKVR